MMVALSPLSWRLIAVVICSVLSRSDRHCGVSFPGTTTSVGLTGVVLKEVVWGGGVLRYRYGVELLIRCREVLVSYVAHARAGLNPVGRPGSVGC